MRVRLKGLNHVRKRLADGTIRDYYYAGKSGPPVKGEYGTPEFIASFYEAVQSRPPVRKHDVQSLIDGYFASDEFVELSRATKNLYRYLIPKIESEFGDLPISALDDRRIKADLLDWRQRLAQNSRRQADLVFGLFRRIIAWGVERGMTLHNPCAGVRRLYSGDRRDKVWTSEQEAAFLKSAPAHMRLPFLLALWTGQRQGDLLKLTWADYNGTHIHLKQNKTGAEVTIPVSKILKAALAQRKSEVLKSGVDPSALGQRTILTTTKGKSWTSDGFRTSWAKACKEAGVEGVTFHDLRGTAVTRLSIAGCSIPQIATFTGHSLKNVHSIIERYLKRDLKLADDAMRMLERSTRLPTKRPTARKRGSQR
jgi:integrase